MRGPYRTVNHMADHAHLAPPMNPRGGTLDAPDHTPTLEVIMAFERQRWTRPGSKDQAIATRLGMRPTHYYQTLDRVLDTQAALAADPVTVNRLRRIRDTATRTYLTRAAR